MKTCFLFHFLAVSNCVLHKNSNIGLEGKNRLDRFNKSSPLEEKVIPRISVHP